MNKKQVRYKLVHDNDGHSYIIRASHEADFDAWVEAMEEGEETEFDFEIQRVNCSGWTFTDPQGWE